MDGNLNVLSFAGSLRKGSYNRAALRAAKGLSPEGMDIEIFELDNIPLYNGDVERQRFPEPVQEFKRKIKEADGLLIVSPEYNYSIPGILKNAIDWASRPPTETPLEGKPTALMGASTGRFGTLRSQLHLRQVCFSLNMPTLLKPELYISQATGKFDENGDLIDEATLEKIRNLLHAFAEWITKIKAL